MPPDLFRDWSDSEPKTLQIGPAFSGKGCRTFATNIDPESGGASMLAVCIKTDPRLRTAISQQPKDLGELDELLTAVGCDLREKLSLALPAVADEDRRKRKLLIVVGFPLIRDTDETVEITDTWAFLTPKNVAEVGIAIGLWIKTPGGESLGLAIGGLSDADEASVPIEVISPQFGPTRETSALASGVSPDPRKTIAVGAGALGSQITQLLAKSGFGSWTINDSDHLAPHNIARHGLSPMWVGWPKARAMAIELSSYYDTDLKPQAYDGDFVRESSQNAEFQKVVDSADLILDMSASVPVARHLASEVRTSARKGSIFLNPSGSDLVMLFEDEDHQLTLDCIEMQYYRAIAFDDGYNGHLKRPIGRIRYARSCRDVSSTIPTNLVSLHAAIAAGEVRSRIESPAASACMWRTESSPMNITALSIELAPVERQHIGDWNLVVSHHVVERLRQQRLSKLPNETGGVLIGSFDLQRKIVYVVETIPSPPDSEEWPTLYIRGNKGLAAEVTRVGSATDGQLEYVGEWHSHPDGYRCHPSYDDLKVFAWLTASMSDVGLPALTAIAGQGHTEWYVGEMLKSGGWETANNEQCNQRIEERTADAS
ncbi:Mov34/MPN/PAD-1 family protein [Rhodopirellula bahusiensis]|uniref:Mov34/MPN/PAD-1 family protein n=1 Tax=Rhodopirellula bahusiensis TaxID=2014065 RepID=UPI00326334B1